MQVVKLTKVDKDRKVILNDIGLITQLIFETLEDATSYLYTLLAEGSTISMKKTSTSFLWVTINKPEYDEDVHYELQMVEPLSFRKKN